MNESVLSFLLIFGVGLVAGFASTMAGVSSFLTLAVLEFAGLPSAMANGTNRIAVEARNLMAVLGFRSKGVFDLKLSVRLAIPTLLGAVLGAYIVIDLPTEVFHRILAVVIIIMLIPILFDAKKWIKTRWLKPQGSQISPRQRLVIYLAFFAVGVYGGAIHAGIGFILIAMLGLLTGEDLVRIASHKVFIIATYTLFTLILFAINGQINWIYGLVLAAGEGIGGWVASRLAVSRGERLVRTVLVIMLAVLAVRYLGIIP